MAAEDDESFQETLYLVSTRANAVHLLRGLAEAKDGDVRLTDLDELAGRFGVRTGS